MKAGRKRNLDCGVRVAAICSLVLAAAPAPAESTYIPITGSAWRLALGDVNGDGKKELLCGLYQGAVSCVEPSTGKTLWERPLGGFPFAVVAADTDGDGKAEAFVACADGKLYAFAPDGKPLWEYAPNSAAKYSVAICRPGSGLAPLVACGGMDRTVHLLSPSGRRVASYTFDRAITQLAAGDLDGDGFDEIIITGTRSGAYEVLRWKDGALSRAQRHRLPQVHQYLESSGQPRSFNVYSMDLRDLDLDGRCEIVLGGEYKAGLPIRALSPEGETLWTTPRLLGPDTPGFERLDYYCMPLVRGGEVDARSPGPEVVVVTGGNLRVLAGGGKVLGEANAPIGFTDLVLDGRTLYLGSSPNGDRTIYRVDLGGPWASVVTAFQRQGLARQIGDNLQSILRQARAAPDNPAPSPRHRITLGASMLSEKNGWADPTADWFRKEYPYEGFELVGSSRLSGMVQGLRENVSLDHEGGVLGPDPKGLPPATFVRHAEGFEKSGRQLTYYISHGCEPRITIGTLDKMLEAAPNALVGFLTHEDEDPQKIPGYCAKYLAPLAERCVARGRTLTMVEKNTFWFDTPSDPKVGPALFNRRNAPALIAGTDDANSRCPELNLCSRVGLRQSGLIGHIASYPIHDLLAFNRAIEWEYPKHGHPFFRLAVAHAVSGADCFDIRVNNFHKNRFTAIAEEAFAPFLHLLGKGLVVTPRPGQMAGLSPLGFVVHHPPREWIEESHNGHQLDRWEEDPGADEGVLPRNACFHGNTPTPSHALSAVLFHKKRQFGSHIPATPYGVVAFVPAHAELGRVAGVREWWHTDGVSIWREGGPRLKGEAAAGALRESFEAAAAKLPFRPMGDDVFFQTVAMEPGRYRIYAIDPGWLDPADRQIEVRIQLPGEFAVRDLLSGEAIGVANGRFPLEVPAGALRIIEVVGGSRD